MLRDDPFQQTEFLFRQTMSGAICSTQDRTEGKCRGAWIRIDLLHPLDNRQDKFLDFLIVQGKAAQPAVRQPKLFCRREPVTVEHEDAVEIQQ
jgi:hypothetical protein